MAKETDNPRSNRHSKARGHRVRAAESVVERPVAQHPEVFEKETDSRKTG
jgi:hypothetical protein